MTADSQTAGPQTGATTTSGSQSGQLVPISLSGLNTDGSGNLQVDIAATYYVGLGGMHLTAVPEPATLALATLGLLGLIGFGRRRKR